jgi:hypothetical protein
LEIRINDQPLAFSLENERTLGEVVRGLERWLAGSELVLYEVRCAGRELLGAPPEEWEATPHAEVERLELTVRHASEVRLANLRTLLEYLEAVRGFTAGPEARGAQELLRGYPLFVESLRRHFSEAETGGELADLAVLGGRPEALLALSPELRDKADGAAARLAERIAGRLEELDDPRAALRRLSTEVEATAAGISEVSVLLAAGRDRQAMEAVVRFSELCQRLLRLLAGLGVPEVGGLKPREYFAEFNRVLGELAAAFQAKDTVLIGDLLEYEIAPRLRQLQAVL